MKRRLLLILLHLLTYTVTIGAHAQDQVETGNGDEKRSEIEKSYGSMAPPFLFQPCYARENRQALHAVFISFSRWLGVLLTLLFMMSVTTILLNILIAQLSLTYELVQEESLNSFTALRMQAVAIIEWQSRFKFWVGTKTDDLKIKLESKVAQRRERVT